MYAPARRVINHEPDGVVHGPKEEVLGDHREAEADILLKIKMRPRCTELKSLEVYWYGESHGARNAANLKEHIMVVKNEHLKLLHPMKMTAAI